MPASFNGRTPGFGPGNVGSIPSAGANMISLLTAAKRAFAAWVNHPDPKFVDDAWDKCAAVTKDAWCRVAEKLSGE